VKDLWDNLAVPTSPRPLSLLGFGVLPSPPCLLLLATAEYDLVECPTVNDGVRDRVPESGILPSELDEGRSEGRV
jgi:hypothetical protein